MNRTKNEYFEENEGCLCFRIDFLFDLVEIESKISFIYGDFPISFIKLLFGWS